MAFRVGKHVGLVGDWAPTTSVAVLLALALCLLVLRPALAFVVAPPATFKPAAVAALSRRATLPRRAAAASGADASSRSEEGPRSATVAEFAGANVLVTGASGGIGRSLALELARCGAGTLLLSGRNVDKLEAVAAECRSAAEAARPAGGDGIGRAVAVLPCDLAAPAAVADLGTAALAACAGRGSGAVDVLINNGGLSSRSAFVDTALEVDELLMRVNFHSGAQLARALVPAMAARGRGRVVWIGSVQGLVGLPSRTSYAASKFAVQGYCEALRAEVAGSGVAVHVVSPGYVRTGLSEAAVTGTGAPHGRTDATTAAGARPDDVARTVLARVATGRGPSDFAVAAGLDARAAVWLRLLAPAFLERLLARRFEKGQRKDPEES